MAARASVLQDIAHLDALTTEDALMLLLMSYFLGFVCFLGVFLFFMMFSLRNWILWIPTLSAAPCRVLLQEFSIADSEPLKDTHFATVAVPLDYHPLVIGELNLSTGFF